MQRHANTGKVVPTRSTTSVVTIQRQRATAQGYKNQEEDLVGGSRKRYETAMLGVYWLTM